MFLSLSSLLLVTSGLISCCLGVVTVAGELVLVANNGNSFLELEKLLGAGVDGPVWGCWLGEICWPVKCC